MALVRINHKSSVSGRATELALLVPEKTTRKKLRVLYLLHGLSDDYSTWLRYTSLERYLRYNTDTLVVMPDGMKSFYTDMAHGDRFYTYITEEIPEFLASVFNISTHRDDTYIAGLSMGGYGAFKIALKNPDKFSAAASFSGALDIEDLLTTNENFSGMASEILGENYDFKTSEENIFCFIKKDSPEKPRLLQMCGTDDFLYQNNLNFKREIENKDYDYEYCEGEGTHSWDYWDKCIQYALEFFKIENN